MPFVRIGERIYFVGPLGIWPYPIVNLILALADRVRSFTLIAPVQAAPDHSSEAVYEVERDSRGKIVRIVERRQ